MTRKQTGKRFLLGAMIGSSLGAISLLAVKMSRAGAFKKFGRAVDDFVRGSHNTIRKAVQKVHNRKRTKR